MKFGGKRKRNKSPPNDHKQKTLITEMLHLWRMRMIYPKPAAAHRICTHKPWGTAPSDPQLQAGGDRSHPSIPGSPRKVSCGSLPLAVLLPTMLALSSWGWEHSPACLGSLLGNTGALSSLTSHPGQMQPPAPARQLQPQHLHAAALRAPLPFTPWVHWVLRQLDIFNLFLSIRRSPSCYSEIYSAFTEEILL